MGESDVDKARERFAYLLVPLVQDRFMSKLDYRAREIEHGIEIRNTISREREQYQQAFLLYLAKTACKAKRT